MSSVSNKTVNSYSNSSVQNSSFAKPFIKVKSSNEDLRALFVSPRKSTVEASFGGSVKVAKLGQEGALVQALIYAIYGLRSICNQLGFVEYGTIYAKEAQTVRKLYAVSAQTDINGGDNDNFGRDSVSGNLNILGKKGSKQKGKATNVKGPKSSYPGQFKMKSLKMGEQDTECRAVLSIHNTDSVSSIIENNDCRLNLLIDIRKRIREILGEIRKVAKQDFNNRLTSVEKSKNSSTIIGIIGECGDGQNDCITTSNFDCLEGLKQSPKIYSCLLIKSNLQKIVDLLTCEDMLKTSSFANRSNDSNVQDWSGALFDRFVAKLLTIRLNLVVILKDVPFEENGPLSNSSPAYHECKLSVMMANLWEVCDEIRTNLNEGGYFLSD